MSVKLIGPDQAELTRTTFPLVRRLARHNEVKFRWDNVLIVNGEPFFPVFVWHTDLMRAYDLGANSAMVRAGSLQEEDLWLARRFGIRLIANPHGNWEGRVKGLADNPMLMAWFIADEPGHENAEPAKAIVDLAALTRGLDPYHPTYANVMPGWGFMRAYVKVFDTWGATTYAAGHGYSEHFVKNTTEQANRLSRGRRPFWPTLQAFYFKHNRKHPTPTEVRHSFYSAILHDAKGLSLWGVGDTPGFDHEEIRGTLSVRILWQQVKKDFREIRHISPIIVSDEPVGAAARCENDAVAMMNRRLDGQVYVFLLNMSQADQKATLVLPQDRATLVNQIEPGGTWPVSNGRCPLVLEPLQPLVLRVDAD